MIAPMMTFTLDGKTYRITPGGLVWAAYQHPHQPGRTLWRRMQRGSIRSMRVLVAAGIEAPPVPPERRAKSRHYADRHCI